MAVSGLDIFKLLPKTNCKKCGMPTCLAFAMALAQKKVGLDQCPDASQAAREALAAAAAPPMRLVTFGAGAAAVKAGGETVLFRHEEKFHNPTVVAVTLPDNLDETARRKRIDAIRGLTFERIGQKMTLDAVAVVNVSGDAATFAAAAAAALAAGKALILVTDKPEAAAAALEKVKDSRPLLCAATAATAEAMAKLAAAAKCPLVARAADAEALAALTEKIKAAGCEEIVLWLDAPDAWSQMAGLTLIRRLAIKKSFRPLGYPTIAFAAGTPETQAAQAAAMLAALLALFIARPMQGPRLEPAQA
jgi:acetyl-CoA decarbonylase/synthase complex subunit gamma